MFEEDEDYDKDITNDEISEDEEDITDLVEDDKADDGDNNNFKILTYKNVLENIEKNKKKTIPIMTKFEKARIFGLRLQQLVSGAKALIDTSKLKGNRRIVEEEIVEEEIKQRKLPFIIRRTLPNGTYEDWKIEEFELI